jgi:SAM-dependent methyltransferase
MRWNRVFRALEPGSAGRRHLSTCQFDGYATNARFVADLAGDVFSMLAPKRREHIMDLGCGDGVLTKQILDSGATVVGVDLNAEFVQSTRRLGIESIHADAQQALPTSRNGTFDAVFSNAALHWMRDDPDAVIRSVHCMLKPGGRFVAECGGHLNVSSIVVAFSTVLSARGYPATCPWYFPSDVQYAARLQAGGFVVKSIGLIPRPTVLPAGMVGWLTTFGDAFLASVPDNEKAIIIKDVLGLLQPVLFDESTGVWTADYVRLRFEAHSL